MILASVPHRTSASATSARTRLLVALWLPLVLSGCYLMQAAGGQLDLNARRRPIDRVVADPATPADVRSQLELVRRVRTFAVRELGLPDNASYRSYADVGRPFVLWNVFAAREFSVDPKTWCFPIAGCVAYRGYFAEKKARKFARRLERRGYDVLVGGVPAYSTLGHFADPVLNTMLGWGETQLAGTLFHELAHQRLYVPGDSAFNEAFATVVEDEGVRRWLAADGRERELAEFLARRDRWFAVSTVLADGRSRLRALYARPLPPDEKRRAKAAEFERMREAYAALKRAWNRGGYDATFGPTMNNASLLAVATYQDCVPGLEARLAAHGGDLAAFYEDARALAKLGLAERHAVVCPRGAPAPADGAPDGSRRAVAPSDLSPPPPPPSSP